MTFVLFFIFLGELVNIIPLFSVGFNYFSHFQIHTAAFCLPSFAKKVIDAKAN